MLEYKHVILFYLSIFAIIAIVAFLIYKRIIFSKKEKDSGLNLLRQMDNWAMPFFNGSRYLNFRLMKIIRSNLSVHYDKIKNRRKDKSFTKYDLVFNIFENPGYIVNYNNKYIEDQKSKYQQYFKNIDEKGYGLTERQMSAVFCDEDSVLVNAGAGTGKTKTIESKVLHLVAHKGVPLHRILVMTYSKKSQIDMLERISDSLTKANIETDADVLSCNISTFHSFGKKVIDLGMSIHNPSIKEETIGRSNKVLSILDESDKIGVLVHVIEQMKQNKRIIDLSAQFLLFFNTPIVTVSEFRTLDGYYRYVRRSLITLLVDTETNYNISVKSHGELLIANLLWQNNIAVQYEPRGHFYTNSKGYKVSYRPDFFLPEYSVYIEYFGVDKNNQTAPFIVAEDYVDRMNRKIEEHEKSGNILIDMRYADLQNGQEYFLRKLKAELIKENIILNPKSSEEVFQIFEGNGSFSGLSKKLEIFLALFKESGEDIMSLSKKNVNYFDLNNRDRNFIFLEIFFIFEKIYADYLMGHSMIDFGDMIVKSREIVKELCVGKKYDYILIDEFQDISKARALLIKELILGNENCKLFCVGDDWQSIYQFAGSDIGVFMNFEEYFGFTKKITLDATFRFNQGISNVSGSFVMMNPKQEIKALESKDKKTKNRISIIQKNNNNDYLLGILSDIIDDSHEKEEISVLFLTRYKLEKYVNGQDAFSVLYPYLQDKEFSFIENPNSGTFTILYKSKTISISYSTIHRSKGLEADYVIVDNVNQKEKFNFPSNFEDDRVFRMITGNKKDESFPFSEERRLFYVSLTRGKNKAYVVYSKWKESYFVRDLFEINKTANYDIIDIKTNKGELSSLIEKDKLPVCRKCLGKMELRDINGSEFWGCENYPLCKCTKGISGSNFCPVCGGTMLLKKNSKTGERFWGCFRFVEGCTGTMEYKKQTYNDI